MNYRINIVGYAYSIAESISMCDTVIDEHFRRSLGNNYMELFDKTGTGAVSPTGTGAVPTIPAAVAVTPVTAVTKTATKRVAKSPPVASPPLPPPAAKKVDKVVEAEDKEDANVNFSVDDHFAKALGETWNKLKATQRREVEVEEVQEEDEQDENESDGMEEEDSSGGFSDSEDDENRSRGNRGKSNKRLRTDRRSD